MMNGSRCWYGMPASVRRTGKPSPSKPVGPVEIDSTGRSVSPSDAPFTRGSTNVSAVTAAMPISLLTRSLRVQLLAEHGGRGRYSTRNPDEERMHMLYGEEHVKRYEETDGAEGYDW